MITSASEREDIIARNLAAVDVHFHNENADSIDLAVGVYTDDSIFEFTVTGGGFRNAPYEPGTRVSLRLVHAFQCRDGKICRENGYEIWRRADDELRVQDDIPENATTEVFG